MMTDKEVRNEVVKRASLLDEKSKKQKRLFFSGISMALCAAVVFGAFTYASNVAEPSHNDAPISNQTTMKLFVPSPSDPDFDAFGEDELAHVDVVLNGSIIYKQIPLEDYPKYGFSDELKETAFGEYLGTVVETGEGKRTDIKIGADDPALAGSKVYYYAPAGCRAAVIVQNQKYCSVFVFGCFADEDKIHSFTQRYSLFGAQAANEIASLSFTVMDENEKQSGPFTVTDIEKINTFYNITSSLVPFEIVNPKAPTPDWLNEAFDEYRNLPKGSKFETISIEVHFKNGLILENITYQPNLTTGYVDGMEALTPEQNKELRDALSAD